MMGIYPNIPSPSLTTLTYLNLPSPTITTYPNLTLLIPLIQHYRLEHISFGLGWLGYVRLRVYKHKNEKR